MTPNFNKIITLSKQIAASLLRDEQPTDLHNTDIFNAEDKKYIEENLSNDELINERLKLKSRIDTQADWQKVNSRIEGPVKRLHIWKYAAAAIIVIALASTYLLKDSLFDKQIENNTSIIVNNQIVPGVDKAILTLEDGTTVALEKGTSVQTQNATSNGEEIIYTNSSSRNVVYNYLTIPRGGEFQLTLSDGTKVWLNSETQLKYPISFTDGESRQVELVYGEAYFEVSHSTEHKGSNFKVYNKNQEVQVLGTEFNIKAYKDETNIYTTLVNGKVAINTTTEKQVLAPNQQANLNIATDMLSIKNVDVRDDIAWVNGEFIVNNKSLKEIMKVLSRWYDMDVTFANKELENVRFVGVLGKDQDIVSILNTIQSFGIIKNYEIKNKNVILK